jgi:hypothetical protein
VSGLSYDAAMAIAAMRGWPWLRCDPDGVPFPPGMDLSSIISRLAFDDVRRPQDAILELLCKGRLVARGSYRWRKYQDMEHYQQEGYSERLAAKHWQTLADAIQSAKIGDGGSYREITYQLTELALEDCLAFVWDYHRDGFSYSNLTPDFETWDDDYLEEWFSAWDIEAWPSFLDEQDAPDVSDDIAATDASEPKPARGRSAAKWWPAFAEELALTVYLEGIPEGTGHEGQSELLDKVLSRLSVAGKPEPGRATVQPVINAVLARIRSAEK